MAAHSHNPTSNHWIWQNMLLPDIELDIPAQRLSKSSFSCEILGFEKILQRNLDTKMEYPQLLSVSNSLWSCDCKKPSLEPGTSPCTECKQTKKPCWFLIRPSLVTLNWQHTKFLDYSQKNPLEKNLSKSLRCSVWRCECGNFVSCLDKICGECKRDWRPFFSLCVLCKILYDYPLQSGCESCSKECEAVEVLWSHKPEMTRWCCTECYSSNSFSMTFCQTCSAGGEGWICRFCVTSNGVFSKTCQGCGKSKETTETKQHYPQLNHYVMSPWKCKCTLHPADMPADAPFCWHCDAIQPWSVAPIKLSDVIVNWKRTRVKAVALDNAFSSCEWQCRECGCWVWNSVKNQTCRRCKKNWKPEFSFCKSCRICYDFDLESCEVCQQKCADARVEYELDPRFNIPSWTCIHCLTSQDLHSLQCKHCFITPKCDFCFLNDNSSWICKGCNTHKNAKVINRKVVKEFVHDPDAMEFGEMELHQAQDIPNQVPQVTYQVPVRHTRRGTRRHPQETYATRIRSSQTQVETFEWSCPSCTFSNTSDQSRCQMCGTQEGSSVSEVKEVKEHKHESIEPIEPLQFLETYDKPVSAFQCYHCQTYNYGLSPLKMGNGRERVKCKSCGKERKGYWTCEKCLTENRVIPIEGSVENGQSVTCNTEFLKRHPCSQMGCNNKTEYIHIQFHDGLTLSIEEIQKMEKQQALLKKQLEEKKDYDKQNSEYERKCKEWLSQEHQDKLMSNWIAECLQEAIHKKDLTIIDKLKQKIKDQPNFLCHEVSERLILTRKNLLTFTRTDRLFIHRMGLKFVLSGLPIPTFWKKLETPMQNKSLIHYLLFAMKARHITDIQIIVCQYIVKLFPNEKRFLRTWLRSLCMFSEKNV